MFSRKPIQFLICALALASRILTPASARAQQNQVMGELQFSGVTNVEKNSGVWIDEQYVGYLKELKGDKKIMLLPGEHEISVRQAGYKDFTSKIIVEPGPNLHILLGLANFDTIVLCQPLEQLNALAQHAFPRISMGIFKRRILYI